VRSPRARRVISSAGPPGGVVTQTATDAGLRSGRAAGTRLNPARLAAS